jgi:benzoylformate decarboxylase
VPGGIEVFQMSADARELGRTYPTKLSMVGDIRASLTVLLSLLAPKVASQAEAYAALRKRAARDQEARRARLMPPPTRSSPSGNNLSADHLLDATEHPLR